MDIVIWVLIVIAVLAVLLAAWRFLTLRSRGTTVILRRLPAGGTHGWRHGTIRYNGDDLEYFKLRSISPMADLVFNRKTVEFHGTRELTAAESSFMASGLSVFDISFGGTRYEIVLDPHGAMALTAWVESAPDIRQERIDHHALREKITRRRGRN